VRHRSCTQLQRGSGAGQRFTEMGTRDTDAVTKKQISETLEEKQQEKDEANNQEAVKDKKRKTEANVFHRVKSRFSTKSKKPENKKSLEEQSDKDIESKLLTSTGDKESIKKEKKEDEEESLDDQNNPERDDNVFVRVKERLSKRSKKKRAEKEIKQHEKDQEKTPLKENEIKNDTKADGQVESGETDACIVGKKQH